MEKLKALVDSYILDINMLSKIGFSKGYMYEALKRQKLELMDYIKEHISLFKKSKEMQEYIGLFNKQAKELSDKVNILFSGIELSAIERNLKENG